MVFGEIDQVKASVRASCGYGGRAGQRGYVQHAHRQGAKRRRIETAIGGLLNKIFPTLRRGRATGGNGRAYTYRFPPLSECRKRFEELMQSSIDWGFTRKRVLRR